MKERSLEISYRRGKPVAGYLHLGTSKERRYGHSERQEAGLVVDFDVEGAPIGIEITAPALVTVEAMNRVLAAIGGEPIDVEELAPLRAA